MTRRGRPTICPRPPSVQVHASPFAILAEGAFAMLRPELDRLPGAPRTAAEFVDRLLAGGPDAVRFLTPAEVADRLGVSSHTVGNWIRDGRLKAVRQSARIIRIPESELDRLEDMR